MSPQWNKGTWIQIAGVLKLDGTWNQFEEQHDRDFGETGKRGQGEIGNDRKWKKLSIWETAWPLWEPKIRIQLKDRQITTR